MKLTPEQQKDLDRLRQHIERECLTGVMNDTKWEELISSIKALKYRPKFRVKCLRQEEAPLGAWDSDWDTHIPWPRKWIEWLDLDPMIIYRKKGVLIEDEKIDFSDTIIAALRAHDIPFSFEGSSIRVWGWIHRGVSPNFA